MSEELDQNLTSKVGKQVKKLGEQLIPFLKERIPRDWKFLMWDFGKFNDGDQNAQVIIDLYHGDGYLIHEMEIETPEYNGLVYLVFIEGDSCRKKEFTPARYYDCLTS